MTMYRSPGFCEEALAFVGDVNAAVTVILACKGQTDHVPETDTTPQVEAAAVLLAANLLALTNGNWELLAETVWPRVAAGNLRQFQQLLSLSTEATQ